MILSGTQHGHSATKQSEVSSIVIDYTQWNWFGYSVAYLGLFVSGEFWVKVVKNFNDVRQCVSVCVCVCV